MGDPHSPKCVCYLSSEDEVRARTACSQQGRALAGPRAPAECSPSGTGRARECPWSASAPGPGAPLSGVPPGLGYSPSGGPAQWAGHLALLSVFTGRAPGFARRLGPSPRTAGWRGGEGSCSGREWARAGEAALTAACRSPAGLRRVNVNLGYWRLGETRSATGALPHWAP